jgi:hypothetical protein
MAVAFFFSGYRYTPLFDFFIELQEIAFRVIADNYVMDGSGTGDVHCALAFFFEVIVLLLLVKIIIIFALLLG